MFLVRALRDGFYNKVMQKEGTEFNVLPKAGKAWSDAYNRSQKDVFMTAKEQLGSWMEVISEEEDPSNAPTVVYVEKGELPEEKASKKKSTKKAVKKVEEPKAESDNSDIVI